MNFLDAQSIFLIKAILALWCLLKAKQFFITGTVVVNREIELQGESATLSTNIYFWNSQNAVFKKMQTLAEAAMQRKDFCWKRFQKTLQEGTNENVAKLKKDG